VWFKALTGFPEQFPERVRENISLESDKLNFRVNKRVFVCSESKTSSLSEPRKNLLIRATIRLKKYQSAK
jgi:hypothetical protein